MMNQVFLIRCGVILQIFLNVTLASKFPTWSFTVDNVLWIPFIVAVTNRSRTNLHEP